MNDAGATWRPNRRATAGSLAVVEAVEGRLLLAADLAPLIPRSLPDVLPPGSTQKITVQVTNVGDASANGAASVALFASTDGVLSGDDVRLGDAVRALRLKPGKATNVKVSVPSPTTLPAGSYSVVAVVDTTSSAIDDANPSNDVVTASTTVTVPQPSVDLVGEFANLPSSPLQAFAGGRKSCATVRVFNTGNSIAQGQLAVSVYLSTDATLDGADVPLGTSPLKATSIKAGGKRNVKVTLQPPPTDTPAGRYSLIAVLDSSNAIVEVNETNNTVVSPTQVPVVKTRPPSYDGHHRHYDDGYYWTDTIYVDTVYYYDDGEWYYPDEYVVIDDGYYDDGPPAYDDYDPPVMYIPDDAPPPPAWDDWTYSQPYTPDPPVDPWNDYAGGGGDTMPDPWNDYAGGDDVWLGDDWGW